MLFPHSIDAEAEAQNGPVTWLMSPSWYVEGSWDPEELLFSISHSLFRTPRELGRGGVSTHASEGTSTVFMPYSLAVSSSSAPSARCD